MKLPPALKGSIADRAVPCRSQEDRERTIMKLPPALKGSIADRAVPCRSQEDRERTNMKLPPALKGIPSVSSIPRQVGKLVQIASSKSVYCNRDEMNRLNMLEA